MIGKEILKEVLIYTLKLLLLELCLKNFLGWVSPHCSPQSIALSHLLPGSFPPPLYEAISPISKLIIILSLLHDKYPTAVVKHYV